MVCIKTSVVASGILLFCAMMAYMDSQRPTPRAPVKIASIGETGAGKTTLFKRYTNEMAREVRSDGPTMGIDLTIAHKQNRFIELWDTSGSEKYYSFSTNYVRLAHGICLCYDASIDEDTAFSNVHAWYTRAQNCRSDFSQVPIVVIGNKQDLMAPRRETHRSPVEQWCASCSIRHFYASALQNTNCIEPLDGLVQRAIAFNDARTRRTNVPPAAPDPSSSPAGCAPRFFDLCSRCCRS